MYASYVNEEAVKQSPLVINSVFPATYIFCAASLLP